MDKNSEESVTVAANTIRVLLVDDDHNYYTITSRMLARSGQDFEVEWVENYDAALAIMRRRQHQIYLIDYHLGNQSGLELVRAAVSEGVDAPMIMMTGQGEYDIDLQAIKAGATDYVDKTELKPGLLHRAIRYALERGRFMAALHEGEQRYRDLLEDASDGIIIAEADGSVSLMNARARELLAQPPAPAPRLNMADLMRQSADSLLLTADLKPAETRISEGQLRRSDDIWIDVEVSARLIDGNQFQYIFRDITQRKHFEEEREKHIQQLTILHQIDDELSQMGNIDVVLSLALDSAVRLSGADAGFIALYENNQLWVKQAIGRYTEIALDAPLPETPLLREIINTQEARFFPAQTDVSPPHAQMIFPLNSLERLVGVLNLETNKPERFTQETFNFIKLITARAAVAVENAQLYRLAQEQLARLTELYEQVKGLEQIKTDMIRIAAHDLRNPVSVISGYAELLRWNLSGLTEKQEHYLASIERSAKRMEKITTDILSLERIENIRADVRQKFSLNDVVGECAADYEPQAEQKKLTIIVHLPADPLIIEADSAQMHEAVSNLISNAIKYTPEGGRITVTLTSEDAGRAVLRVVDTGFGIPADQQASLFKPFYRAHSNETVNIEGTGLGLHLVKNIIERYGGEMLFSSTYGQGSTFGFSIPVV